MSNHIAVPLNIWSSSLIYNWYVFAKIIRTTLRRYHYSSFSSNVFQLLRLVRECSSASNCTSFTFQHPGFSRRAINSSFQRDNSFHISAFTTLHHNTTHCWLLASAGPMKQSWQDWICVPLSGCMAFHAPCCFTPSLYNWLQQFAKLSTSSLYILLIQKK